MGFGMSVENNYDEELWNGMWNVTHAYRSRKTQEPYRFRGWVLPQIMIMSTNSK